MTAMDDLFRVSIQQQSLLVLWSLVLLLTVLASIIAIIIITGTVGIIVHIIALIVGIDSISTT